MNLLKMCGPQIRLCLFTFRPIASKQLNSLTTIVPFSWLGDAHSLWVREVPGSISGSGKGFYVWFLFCFVYVFWPLCPKTHYLSQHFTISFAILIYLVYLTYCNICDRLKRYKDTDLASLTVSFHLSQYCSNKSNHWIRTS